MRGAPCLICGQPGATTAYFWTGGRDTHLYAAFDALWEQERGSKESRGSVGSPPSQKNGPPHRHGEAQAREEPDRRGRDLDRRDGGGTSPPSQKLSTTRPSGELNVKPGGRPRTGLPVGKPTVSARSMSPPR